jgi:formylglycine-generating enzyme required for sulfatase activity
LAVIEMVTVDNPGNAPDTTGRGSVASTFRMGKFEVTAAEYTEFLNAVAKDDPNGLYNSLMGSTGFPSLGANIQRSGSSPNFSYSVAADWADRPVNYVGVWDVARFANWLHNDQPTGPKGPGTTEDGAYHDVGNQALFGRNPGARYFIPTEDEWYKAAYHNKSAGSAANYFDFPTGANAQPGQDVTEASSPGNNANYYSTNYSIGPPYYRTVAGEFELSDSPYGTFDQGGNIFEWTETGFSGVAFNLRGGAYTYEGFHLNAHQPGGGLVAGPGTERDDFGFRVATVIPEPTTLVIAALAIAQLFLNRRRRS